MNTTLTPQQIASYQKDGFIAQPGFLSPAEVAELKAAVLESVSVMGNTKIAGREPVVKVGENYYDGVFTQRVNLWRINEVVKRYMMAQELGKMICDLGGVPGYRLWHDQTLIKEAWANPTAWHSDNPKWSFYSPNAISIWIALEDATLGNGCMWFLPGTHKMGGYENAKIDVDMGGIFKIYPEMANVDAVAVPMRAGDCSFHNGLTVHGAGPNMTRGRRIAMTCIYMPVGSTFNGHQNVLTREYFKSLKVGDVLENDDYNPVVYAREQRPVSVSS
jgi:phytanoyl-CoA hydroxylase